MKRSKFDFNKLQKELEKELESVKDSPRGLFVMFDAYMTSVITELIALRFDSGAFEKKNLKI